MKNIFSVSVFCSGLIFFFAYIKVVISSSIIALTGQDQTAYLVPVVSAIFPVFLGIVSLSCSLYAIRELRKNSKRWYYAIPFAFALGILCFSNPLDLARGGHNLEFFYISQVLATITSAGFFLSFPDTIRCLTRYFAALSGVVGVFGIISLFTLVPVLLNPHGSSDALFVGLLIISWMILLPIVGSCFIVTAFRIRESAQPVPS